MEQERRPTVRAASVAAVDDNTVTGRTVAESTVHNPNDATIFDNAVPKIILEIFSAASQPESTKMTRIDM